MDPKYIALALKRYDKGMSDDLANRVAANLASQEPGEGGWEGLPGVYEMAHAAQQKAGATVNADAVSGAGRVAPGPTAGLDLAGLKKKYPESWHGRFDHTVKRLAPRYVQLSREQDPEFARRDFEQRLQEDFENPQYAQDDVKQQRVQRYQELMAKQMRGEPIDQAHQQWLQQVHTQVEPQQQDGEEQMLHTGSIIDPAVVGRTRAIDEGRRLSNGLAPQLGAGLLMPFTESLRAAAGEQRYPAANADNVQRAFPGSMSRDMANIMVKKLSGIQ